MLKQLDTVFGRILVSDCGSCSYLANKICSKNVLITFPLSYENIISECSLNVQNVQFFKCFKNVCSWLFEC